VADKMGAEVPEYEGEQHDLDKQFFASLFEKFT
jgi:hypothetical protein